MCLPAHDGFLGYSDLQCVQLLPLLLRFAYLLPAHATVPVVLLLLRMLHATAVPHEEDFAPHASERTLFHMPQRGPDLQRYAAQPSYRNYGACLYSWMTGTTWCDLREQRLDLAQGLRPDLYLDDRTTLDRLSWPTTH